MCTIEPIKCVNPIWPFLYSAGLGIAFLYYWPTLLAQVSRTAPAKVNATAMGIVFMSWFISNNLIGWIGGFYEKMSPAKFWAVHAAIAAGGGLLVLLLGRHLTRVLQAAGNIDINSMTLAREFLQGRLKFLSALSGALGRRSTERLLSGCGHSEASGCA